MTFCFLEGGFHIALIMTTELRFLAATVILGLLHLIVDSHLISFQRGYRWTASSREQPMPPLHGMANQVDQAYTNFMETFPFFAAVVLAVHFAGRHDALTVWGTQLYFWGRVGYVMASAAGLGLVRSVLFFNTALSGIVLFLIALLT
jgi:uncharacterized MAPEG superfamily protein